MPVRIGYLLPTREQVMQGRPEAAPLLALAERAEGLGYDIVSKLNPKLVMMSMSAFGAGSLHRDCRAYGSTLEQGSGLPSVVGDAGGPPVMSHTAFGDAVGGLNGCAAVLTALINAKLTGKGQFIDLAQIECMMPFAAPWIVATRHWLPRSGTTMGRRTTATSSRAAAPVSPRG